MVVSGTEASGGMFEKEDDEVFDIRTTPILGKSFATVIPKWCEQVSLSNYWIVLTKT